MRDRPGLLTPAKMTTPSAMARTGSPSMPGDVQPAVAARAARHDRRRAAGRDPRRRLQRRDDVDARRRARPGRVLVAEVARDHPPPGGQDQDPRGRWTAPCHPRRSARPRCGAARRRTPRRSPCGCAFHISSSVAPTSRLTSGSSSRFGVRSFLLTGSAGAPGDAVHARLDPEQAVRAALALVVGVAAAAEARERGERERIAVRGGRRGEELRSSSRDDRRRVGLDAAERSERGLEAGSSRAPAPRAPRARSTPVAQLGARGSVRATVRAPARACRPSPCPPLPPAGKARARWRRR